VFRGTAIPWDQGVAGQVFHSKEPALICDVKKRGHHFAGIDDATGYITRDMISIPLKRWKGEPIGVLNVLNKREGTLDESDLALLMIVSAFAALAIEQARLFDEAKLDGGRGPSRGYWPRVKKSFTANRDVCGPHVVVVMEFFSRDMQMVNDELLEPDDGIGSSNRPIYGSYESGAGTANVS